MDHRARLRGERQAKSAARFHFSSVDLALRGAHSSHFGRPASPRILQGDHPPSAVCRPRGGGARPALQNLSGPTLFPGSPGATRDPARPARHPSRRWTPSEDVRGRRGQKWRPWRCRGLAEPLPLYLPAPGPRVFAWPAAGPQAFPRGPLPPSRQRRRARHGRPFPCSLSALRGPLTGLGQSAVRSTSPEDGDSEEIVM